MINETMSSNLPYRPERAYSVGEVSPVSGWNDPPPDEEAGIGIGRYLEVVRRYRWLVLGATLLGGLAGALAGRFVQPVYQVQAVLWIENSSEEGPIRGPLRSGELLQSSAWIDLLRSFVVLDEVVRDRRLYVGTDPRDRTAFNEFEIAPNVTPGNYRLDVSADGRSFTLLRDGVPIESGRVGGPVGAEMGFIWNPGPAVLTAGREIRFSVANPRDAAVALGDELDASLAYESNLLQLGLSGVDPDFAAGTLNMIADRYVAVAAELKRSQLDQLTEVLSEQLTYAETNLREAEIALEGFRVQTVTLPSDRGGPVAAGLEITRDPVMTRFFSLQTELDQYRNDRESVQRILRDSRTSGLPLDALGMVDAVRQSGGLRIALEEYQVRRAERRSLLENYTEDHPSVVQVTRTIREYENETIPALANELIAQISDRENELSVRIESASRELRQIPPRAIEEARLERQVTAADNLHMGLKERYEEVRLAAASTIADIRILDRAVPPSEPVNNRALLMLAMGLFGGLGLSIGGVILLDRFDPRVRYPEEVIHGMGLSILGVLPFVGRVGSKAGAEATSQAAEAFREIRMNVLYSHGAAGPVMLTITSPSSGDGKSFVSSNLALTFADQSERTLLIDGDIRRGALHRKLGCNRVPGLTDYLAGESTLEEVLQKTDVPNVSLIGAGTRRPDGPELLSSSRMSELLVALRPRFDVIVVDSPPLGAGVDAFVLGTLTRNMVMVLRTGTTDRALARAKLAMVDRLPIRMLGAVLNAATTMSGAYKYYSYIPGYEVVESGEEVKLLVQ